MLSMKLQFSMLRCYTDSIQQLRSYDVDSVSIIIDKANTILMQMYAFWALQVVYV